MRDSVLVIIGRSNSGKDTLLKLLSPWFNSRLVNVKFAEPGKIALAGYLGVPVARLEDREYRTTVIPELGCTPLDLMVKMYRYMPKVNPWLGLYYTKKQVEAVLGGRYIPVFTDLRNPAECDYAYQLSLAGVNVYTIYIKAPGRQVEGLPSDECLGMHLMDLHRFSKAFITVDNTPDISTRALEMQAVNGLMQNNVFQSVLMN